MSKLRVSVFAALAFAAVVYFGDPVPHCPTFPFCGEPVAAAQK